MSTPARRKANSRWQKTHPEAYSQHLKDWRKNNADYVRGWARKKRQGLIGPFTRADGPDWRERNRQDHLEKKRASTNACRERDFLEAIEHYGKSRCFCCGEAEPIFLALDHINGGGRQHRMMAKISHMATWAKRHGWPPLFRVACHNCNHGLHRNNGVCPHQMKKVA
jgi:hypothetical protein